jgi:hypothetical protein
MNKMKKRTLITPALKLEKKRAFYWHYNNQTATLPELAKLLQLPLSTLKAWALQEADPEVYADHEPHYRNRTTREIKTGQSFHRPQKVSKSYDHYVLAKVFVEQRDFSRVPVSYVPEHYQQTSERLAKWVNSRNKLPTIRDYVEPNMDYIHLMKLPAPRVMYKDSIANLFIKLIEKEARAERKRIKKVCGLIS